MTTHAPETQRAAPPAVILVNEFSIPRLILRVVLRRPTTILGTYSVVRGQFAGHLDSVVERLRRFGPLVDAATPFPGIEALRDYGDFQRLTDPFAEAEPWIADRFDFAGSDRRFGAYALAYRHLCCNGLFPRLRLAHIVRHLRTQADGTRILGVDGLDHALGTGVLGTPEAKAGGTQWRLRPLVNGLLALAIAARSTLWVLSRLRWRPPPCEVVEVAVDHVGNRMDLALLDTLVKDPARQLFVFRTPLERAAYGDGCADRPIALRRDGWFSLRQIGPALVLAIFDPLRLFARAAMLESDLFKVLANLPFHRLVMRGLLNRFAIRTFIAHDDYNSEHALHTLEMRHRGTLAVGLMHGLTSISSVVHQYRHLDFDLYFLIGRWKYDRYHTWPARMRQIETGSMAATRRDFEIYDSAPPSRDIVCIVSPCYHMDRVADAIAAAAEAFPERAVVLNVKGEKYMRGTFKAELDRLLAGHGNVRLDMGRSYDLIHACGYVIGESSTLIAEAVQFGKVAFALDVDPRTKYLLHRDFPDICVHSGAELVKRIEAVEAGTWTYPRERFADLIRLDGQRWYDVIPAAIEAAHAEHGRHPE